jgi:hypothetical protein
MHLENLVSETCQALVEVTVKYSLEILGHKNNSINFFNIYILNQQL